MDEVSSDNMVTIMLVGFVIFLAAWLFSYLAISGLSSKLEKKEVELNKVKAKLYDLEHPETEVKKPKKVEAVKPAETPEKTEDEKYTEE